MATLSKHGVKLAEIERLTSKLAYITLRLTNKHREQGGQWFYTDRNLAYARSLLADMRREEPSLDWHLECRGTVADWHRWQEPSELQAKLDQLKAECPSKVGR